MLILQTLLTKERDAHSGLALSTSASKDNSPHTTEDRHFFIGTTNQSCVDKTNHHTFSFHIELVILKKKKKTQNPATTKKTCVVVWIYYQRTEEKTKMLLLQSPSFRPSPQHKLLQLAAYPPHFVSALCLMISGNDNYLLVFPWEFSLCMRLLSHSLRPQGPFPSVMIERTTERNACILGYVGMCGYT